MKSSLQVSVSSAMKTSFLSFSVLFLVLSVFGGNAIATTPIAVDMYQDMESGNAGDVLTTAIMNASSHPSSGWASSQGTMWVSTLYHRDLPSPILVGGVTYNGTGGSRSWTFKDDNQLNYVVWTGAGHSNVTMACYYTTLTTLTHQVGYDTLIMWGSSFACMQTLGGEYNGGNVPLLRPHSAIYSHSTAAYVTLGGPNGFDPITTGKTYWVNMKYDGSVAKIFSAIFDPDNSYAQLGSTLLLESQYNDTSMGWKNYFGRGDQHQNQSNDLTYSYFDQMMYDWTNAAFPLLPSGANDSTAPGAPPIVRDGTGATDLSIALSTTQLSANWDMAWDAESGIKAYQYAIGTTQGGTNVTNWTTIKNQLGVTQTGLSLTTGQTYYFSVKAQNGVGQWGPAANSNGQTVGTDTTAPSAPAAVRDAGWAYNYMPDIDCWTDSHDLYGNFDYAVDNESGISFYQFAIGTTPGATDFYGWTNLAANLPNPWATNLSPAATPGQRYYFTVRAVNNAGITGPAANSNGVVVVNGSDTTPPSAPPAVRDGTGADISTQTSTTQLSANWDNSTDNESGISGYYYAIGTTVGGSDIVGDTRVTYSSPVSSITRTGLSLSVGQTYYFRIKAINGITNGLVGAATNSNGVTVVSSGGNQPPSAPANVRDGTGADIAYTTSNTQLSANWDASTDPDGSVTAYQYAIGTSAGGTQTVNWTTLSNVTTVTKTGLSLTNGQTYYFSVKAVDNQGLAGNATNSNGQTVDTTAPSAPANVRDGVGADISTTSSTTQLSANWDASADAESGISGYQYAIGTTAGGTQTVNWTSLGNVTTITKTGLTLSVGQTYYFSVKAVNGAGLTGSATNSNGQTVVSGGSSATAVDVYQDMENGNNNDVLTATIMNASSHPSGSNWSTVGGTMWVSTSHHSDLPGPVVCGGVTYNGTGGTRSWVVNNNNGLNYVRYWLSSPTKLTVAYYFTTDTTLQNNNGYEQLDLWGGSIWVGIQTANGDGNGPYLRIDSRDSSGVGTNSGTVKITSGKTYWLNLKYDSAAQMSSLALFDPANSFAQVGSTVTAGSAAVSIANATFGRCDNYGNKSNDATQSWFDQILFDSTNAAFPLIPSGADSTPPSAPPAVRDGTGTDISTTTSTTQLSANWDASTDNESGISGYQYAIGTSAGGTQTVNWTSLGNVTTVTKTGLTLSVGQTYYFSVKAVNGAGLTGSATNSNGQTVVSSAVTYFSDNFENWTVHGGAWSSVSGETATQTQNTSTDFARAGTKSLKLTDSDTTNSYGACLVKSFSPTIASGIYVRFYVYLPSAYISANNGAAWRRMLRVFCNPNRGQMSIASGKPVMEEVGGWTASLAPSAISSDAWHCIEMYMATPSSSTAMQYWVDGTSTGTLTGSFSGSTSYDRIEFGDVSVGSGTNVTGTFYLDEVIVSDTYNGPLP